jgi:hypothetical protein
MDHEPSGEQSRAASRHHLRPFRLPCRCHCCSTALPHPLSWSCLRCSRTSPPCDRSASAPWGERLLRRLYIRPSFTSILSLCGGHRSRRERSERRGRRPERADFACQVWQRGPGHQRYGAGTRGQPAVTCIAENALCRRHLNTELGARLLTTKPDHNRIRQGPTPTDVLIAAVPGERPYPTACAYFASRGSFRRLGIQHGSTHRAAPSEQHGPPLS